MHGPPPGGTVPNSAQFDGAYQIQAVGSRRCHGLIVAREGIMIGDSERLQTNRQRAIDQFQRSARAIGFVGVRVQVDHRANLLSRSAFAITETELKVIAALAIMGLRSSPKNGYRTPAATGTPMVL